MCSRFSLGWSKNPPYRLMFPANQTLADLRARFAHTGRLEWIGVRPERGRIESVTQAELAPERGLLGDHRAAQVGGKRQITLIQFEHLGVIAALCGREVVSPALLRRNLAVSSISWLCTTGLFASVRHGAKAAVYATPARAWRKLWGPNARARWHHRPCARRRVGTDRRFGRGRRRYAPDQDALCYRRCWSLTGHNRTIATPQFQPLNCAMADSPRSLVGTPVILASAKERVYAS